MLLLLMTLFNGNGNHNDNRDNDRDCDRDRNGERFFFEENFTTPYRAARRSLCNLETLAFILLFFYINEINAPLAVVPEPGPGPIPGPGNGPTIVNNPFYQRFF